MGICKEVDQVCYAQDILSYHWWIQDRIIEEPGFPYTNRCETKYLECQ